MKPSPDSTPPAPHQTRSVFAGRGLFTAWDATAGYGRGEDWIAYQIDPEGTARVVFASKTRVWMARPTQDKVNLAANYGIPFIAQAESEAEYETALALDTARIAHKALVGNCGDWWDGDRVKAAGWELIIEAYDCEQADLYKRLDSKGYPISSYLYGCYEGAAGRVSLAEYRVRYPTADWSVYLAETMTPEDWDEFSR